jgi:hypothetical protein
MVATAAVSTAAAVDFGGAFDNDSKFRGNTASDFKCDQKDTVSAWIRTPFDNDGNTYFAAEALYQYENDFAAETKTNVIDVDLFKFGWSKMSGANKISLSAGRFSSFDLSGVVFNQAADGILFRYEMPRFAVSAYGGYTGLLNAQMVTILTPAGETFEIDSGKAYVCAAKYGIASLSITLPYIVANQTISAQFFGTFRLEDTSYNRMYGTLGLNGSIIPSLFYTITSTLGMTSYDGASYDLSNLTTVSVTLYPSKTISFGLNGVYASGEQGPFKAFTGFTSETASNALDEPQYTGIAEFGLSATVKPVKNVLAGASADIVFDALDSVEYDGFQYKVNASWQIVSDVQAGAVFYQYKDNDTSGRDKSCLQLKAVITF